jgi:hypothetical protein
MGWQCVCAALRSLIGPLSSLQITHKLIWKNRGVIVDSGQPNYSEETLHPCYLVHQEQQIDSGTEPAASPARNRRLCLRTSSQCMGWVKSSAKQRVCLCSFLVSHTRFGLIWQNCIRLERHQRQENQDCRSDSFKSRLASDYEGRTDSN